MRLRQELALDLFECFKVTEWTWELMELIEPSGLISESVCKVITALRNTTSVFYFEPVVKVSFLKFVKGGNLMDEFLLNPLINEQTGDLFNPNGNIGC